MKTFQRWEEKNTVHMYFKALVGRHLKKKKKEGKWHLLWALADDNADVLSLSLAAVVPRSELLESLNEAKQVDRPGEMTVQPSYKMWTAGY